MKMFPSAPLHRARQWCFHLGSLRSPVEEGLRYSLLKAVEEKGVRPCGGLRVRALALPGKGGLKRLS